MMIKINQWAVGQGGFHSGIFNTSSMFRSQEKFVYIFDFGTHSTTSSMTRKQILNRELDKFLEIYGDDCCKIDILFLSHLDEDHHNGIRDILNDHSKYTIKNLVIPHAELAERLISLAILCHSKKSSISEEQIEVMLNPTRYFTRILGENTRIFEYGGSFENLELDNNSFEVSGSELISRDYAWKLKPYMQRSLDTSDIREIFFTEVQKQMSKSGVSIGNSIDGKDLESEIKNILDNKSKIDIKKLIRILSDSYVESGKKISKPKTRVTWKNLVSLNLYSGPVTNRYHRYVNYWGYHKLLRCNHEISSIRWQLEIGWMLTGDADLNPDYFSSFSKFFANELPLTRFFSLPHHGSLYNWNLDNFNNIKSNPVYLIEFGTKNSHHHPSGVILNDMNARKFNFIGITERSRDRFGMQIII